MNIKEWLNRGYWATKARKQLESRVAKAYSEIYGTYSSDNERVQMSKTNTTDKRYIKYIELKNQLTIQIEKRYDIIQEIDKVISCVNDERLQFLLRARYTEFCTWDKIAEEMNYDKRHIFRLHKKALAAAESILK